ncbi:hypothetical protein NBRC10512_004281 [Rhodotorula toruloides]|uniref:RHTO0S04e11738g1_1 n=2 Tax=Rhodotorula toruloides TaxID=5286 RepID=A0A061ARW3_RHOTO|nr:sphingosine kinase 1 [Rhodotorula toruloides NP11]EMS18416.1 sphingosine kinase 1 [Rhodotorula toruloides NP11]CDR39899.1 RHTO0S04e11738g1_1 [Rhodotorula toruloides]
MSSEQIPTEPVDAPSFLAQHAPHIDLTRLTKTPRPHSHLTVILNPSAGSRHAPQLWTNLVQPILSYFLSSARNTSWLDWSGEVEGTRDARDGERIGREIARQAKEGRKEVLLVFGGDGTVHEVINGLLMREDGSVREGIEVELVLIPTGTANALYYHLFPPESASYPPSSPLSPLYSLLSFLCPAHSSTSSPHPLPLALNALPTGKKVLTTVVSSTALHACLLHTAERLRHERPELEGTERFKVAAREEAGRWWDGRLILHHPRRYDPSTKSWVEQGEEEVVRGPFSYLVSSLVSRFEQTFLVAPFRSPLSPLAPVPGEASIDVIAIRPLRRRATRALVETGKEDQAREGFVGRLWEVTGEIYDGGRHVDAMYDDEGEEGSEGKGKSVVEVWRCEGFEWVPDTQQSSPATDASQESSDSDSALKARLVCLDGSLHDLGPNGTLRVEALAGRGVRVWA